MKVGSRSAITVLEYRKISPPPFLRRVGKFHLMTNGDKYYKGEYKKKENEREKERMRTLKRKVKRYNR
jgi:hypothetical protein